jgi:hypothetical protein
MESAVNVGEVIVENVPGAWEAKVGTAATVTSAQTAYFNTPDYTRAVARTNTTPTTYATPTTYTTSRAYASLPVYASPTADTKPLINPSTPALYSTSTTYTTHTASPLARVRFSTPTSDNANTRLPATATKVSDDQGLPSKSTTTCPPTVLTPSESQPHYELRPQNTSVQSKASPQPPLSEFRTHAAEPGPTTAAQKTAYR